MGLTFDNGWNENQQPSPSLPRLTWSAVIQLFFSRVWLSIQGFRRAWACTVARVAGPAIQALTTLMTAWTLSMFALGMWSLPGSQNVCWTSSVTADSLLRKTWSTFSVLAKALFKQSVFIVEILEKTFPSRQPKQGK